ncbi:MAG: hypothetical protein ACOX6T_08300 [Myxococcales bacterium]
MAKKQSSNCRFTARVSTRRIVAKKLQEPVHADRVARSGLLLADLVEIQNQGELAERYDREQQADLANQRVALGTAATKWRAVVEEDDALRSRMPAVIRDLEANPETASHAAWLTSVSFERYRLRPATATSAPAQGDGSNTADSADSAAKRERVVRNDRLSHVQEISHFSKALLEAERAPIVAALEARGFGRDRLIALSSNADAHVALLGSATLSLSAPEAGGLEAEAVAAQKAAWEACKRMIRAAVAGDLELERLFAAC